MNAPRNQAMVAQPSDAALRGASLAFSKPPVKPKSEAKTYTGGKNGALLAATKVGTGNNSRASTPVPSTNYAAGGNTRIEGRPNLSPTQTGSRSSSSTLGVPEDPLDRIPSPSNIAARLAAARYSPRPPMPQASNAPNIMSERVQNERDVLPPTGSVGSVLARLEKKDAPSSQVRKRRDSLGSQSVSNVTKPAAVDHKPLDESPIPPTSSIVSMFEQRRPVTPPQSTGTPLHFANSSPPPVKSPKPQRAFKLPAEPEEAPLLVRSKTRTPPPVKPKPKSTVEHKIELPHSQFTDGASKDTYFSTPRNDPMKSPPIKQKPTKLAALQTTPQSPPAPPPQRRTSRQSRPRSEDIQSQTSQLQRISTAGSEQEPSSPASFKSAKSQQDEEKAKPSLPPPRRSTTKIAPASETGKPPSTAPIPIRSSKQNQSSSPMRPPEKFTPPRRPSSASGNSPGSVYHNQYQRDSVKKISQHMTGESLSSAMMGAALASSRNASPAPSHHAPSIEPLFPPRRHHHSPFHRSPSPRKQSPPKAAPKMRTTMRKEHSSSDSSDKGDKYKKKGTRYLGIKGRKHPNKHHEGTRRRWRDQIKETERKRYEGVWAANKGLYLPLSSTAGEDDPTHDVLNFVVQDIWTRSRLPTHVLEEVWDLVDSRNIGRLKRDEFVVGLWLVDQRLKGRKLPVKVSDSVWISARGLGVKVKVRR